MGKGDGSDLRVKIILKKELVFQCVCAKQENCTVSFHTNQITLSSVDGVNSIFPLF